MFKCFLTLRKIFKDALKIRPSLIQVYSLPYLCFFFSKFLINTKNLSSAAILIFRRCFRSNSLSAFHKIGVLLNFCEILRKEYMSESVFNNVADLLAWNFKLKTASRMFFNELRKNFKNTFLEDTSRLLLLKTWHSNF